MDSSEHGAPDLPLCGKHALVLQPSTLAVPLLSHGWPCVKYILHASTLDLRKMVLRLTVLATNQRFTRSARHAQQCVSWAAAIVGAAAHCGRHVALSTWLGLLPGGSVLESMGWLQARPAALRGQQ